MAALPYRIDADGSARVMLITSRETRRWVIPKGNLIPGLDPHQAAAHEAFEEAGVSGIAGRKPIGSFSYEKRRGRLPSRTASVTVFPLAVTTQLDAWPEQHERDTRWFTLVDAVKAVDEPELKAILAGFHGAPVPGSDER